jgi:hypothetical protein
VSEKTYLCSKCGYSHRYTSKIGVRHLQYIASAPVSINSLLIQDTDHPIPEQEHNIPKKIKETSKNKKGLIHWYRESYSNGVEKYGIWWTIFHLSMWSFVLIFLLTAGILFVVYLPMIGMIYWELE